MSEPYRILALDGGGMRGIFTAAVIASLERDSGEPLVGRVDLIAGTSTGGIIGLGLASGKSGEEMLRFYEEEGPRIFARPRRLRWPWRPKYDRSKLDEVLHREFGETRLNGLDTAVAITAHELIAGTTRVWKDDHHPTLREGGDQLVWKVAAATAAAPTYFAPVQLGTADSHIDGGIWANNPAMVGIVEAVRYGNRELGDVRVLSVGTTTKPFRAASHERASRMGLIAWVREARNMILSDSTSMASDHQARLLLGEGAYLRLDHARSTEAALDDVSACRPLRELGEQVARNSRDQVAALLAPND
jgi:patatin-like phospholipase/acyl hydrolase